MGVDKPPAIGEPAGGLLALLAGLYEDDVAAVFARRGLVSYESLTAGPFVHVPHDAVVPGARTVGDLADVAAALAPRPLRLEALIDGVNRPASAAEIQAAYGPARDAYRARGAEAAFSAAADDSSPARWLAERLRPGGRGERADEIRWRTASVPARSVSHRWFHGHVSALARGPVERPRRGAPAPGGRRETRV